MSDSSESEEFEVWSLLGDESDGSVEEQPNTMPILPYLDGDVYRLRKISYYHEEIHTIFQERIRNNFPILITDFVSEWPAIEKWKSVEYLAALFGTKSVTNYEAKDNRSFFKNELTVHHKMPGNEMVNKILSDQVIESKEEKSQHSEPQRWYCRAGFRKRFLGDVKIPYRMVLPSTEADCLNNEEFSLPFRKHNCTVWVGTTGNITPLHFDLCHGFLCHVQGTKIVTFYHKDDYRSVYPTPYGHINRTASQLIDYKGYMAGDKKLQQKFPKLKELTPYVCELNPGDILYIPPYFWHHVECLTPTVSVVLPIGKSEDDPAHAIEFYSGDEIK